MNTLAPGAKLKSVPGLSTTEEKNAISYKSTGKSGGLSFNKSLLTGELVLMVGEVKWITVKCLVNMSSVPYVSVASPLPLLLLKVGKRNV